MTLNRQPQGVVCIKRNCTGRKPLAAEKIGNGWTLILTRQANSQGVGGKGGQQGQCPGPGPGHVRQVHCRIDLDGQFPVPLFIRQIGAEKTMQGLKRRFPLS